MTCIKFSLRMHRIDLGRSYNGKTFSTSRDNTNLVCSSLTHLQSSVIENQFHSFTWLQYIRFIRLQGPLMDSLRPDSPQQKALYPKLLRANNNQLYSHNEQQSFWNYPFYWEKSHVCSGQQCMSTLLSDTSQAANILNVVPTTTESRSLLSLKLKVNPIIYRQNFSDHMRNRLLPSHD